MERVPTELLDALRKALADPTEHRLYRSGKLPGLFAGRGGAAGEAAALALRDRLFELTRTETKGKVAIEWVRLTAKGVDLLYEQESPVQMLRGLRATLETNRDGVPAWLAEMRATLRDLETRLTDEAGQWQRRLEGMERRLEETLRRLEATALAPPADLVESYPWAGEALSYLDRRRASGAAGLCPLPELFEAVTREQNGQAGHGARNDLSISTFHEGLRRLQSRWLLRLKAVDGPAGLPKPEYALLEGGKVFYLAGV